jgi:RNA polymerase sigma-70 factor, ECF subfamily
MNAGAKPVTEAETDIVRRAKQGDHPAFTQLFQRYRRPVLGFLYGMTGRHDFTEDLLQETVRRAFTLLPHLREEAKFPTWLFGIARNVAREKNRLRPRDRNRIDLESSEVETLADSKPDPETDAIRQQMLQGIRAGFAALDEDRRTALTLRVLGEKRYQEIAEITGWSLARVKVEIHRARIEMRKKLEPYMGI